MLSLSPATRIFLALSPVDGRKSFNGLHILVKEVLQQEPTSGFLFVFTNKSRNRLKILFWDGSGLCLFSKRLERSTYAWPSGEGVSSLLRRIVAFSLAFLIRPLKSTLVSDSISFCKENAKSAKVSLVITVSTLSDFSCTRLPSALTGKRKPLPMICRRSLSVPISRKVQI